LLLATLPALLFLIVWSIGANSYSQGQVASAIQAQTGETAHIATTLVNSLANGLTLLDGDQAANPPKTMAELNPLLEAKGITLASDTQDYMIPIAVRPMPARRGSAGSAASPL
jgi:phosphate transport system permease protein